MKQLRNILFIDIETVSVVPTYSGLSERMQACWQHKAARIAPELSIEEAFVDKAAIYAEFGKVITISAGFFLMQEGVLKFKIKSIFSDNENDLLLEFNQLLSKFPAKELKLCAHNGKEFDYPYLCRRMVINQVPLPSVLDIAGLKPWEVNHLDTLEMWKYGDKKSYTSLELLAATLDAPTSKDTMDGSQVGNVYYKENNLEKIAQYCAQDVATTAQVYLRMNLLPLLDKEHFIFV